MQWFTFLAPECFPIEGHGLNTRTHGDSLYELCTMGAEGGGEVDLQVQIWGNG